uniref:Uncharacterized protein n=1 Tax=Plectus sambesii TaxID=2011161 RepID=A0A914UZ40_9BILA
MLADSEKTTTTTTLAHKKPINQCALEYELALSSAPPSPTAERRRRGGAIIAQLVGAKKTSRMSIVGRLVVTSDRRQSNRCCHGRESSTMAIRPTTRPPAPRNQWALCANQFGVCIVQGSLEVGHQE